MEELGCNFKRLVAVEASRKYLFSGMDNELLEFFEFEAAPTKGSRFIAALFPMTEPSMLKPALKARRIALPSAGHHCFAYRLSSGEARSADDGEPAGSAGRPMLQVLEGAEVINTLAVVSRCFGGVKLGVGGLIRAYSGALSQALPLASWVPFVQTEVVEFAVPYSFEHILEKLEALNEVVETSRVYGAEIRVSCKVRLGAAPMLKGWLTNITHGQVSNTTE